MVWKCNACGFEANPDADSKCEACGYSEATILMLTSRATGKSIEMQIATAVGKQLLKSFVGDESRFASDVQFRLARDAASGDWTVTHDSSAANPTFLDVQPLVGSAVVKDGSVLSIGPEKMCLTVSIRN
jgi:hypothetical protein